MEIGDAYIQLIHILTYTGACLYVTVTYTVSGKYFVQNFEKFKCIAVIFGKHRESKQTTIVQLT